MTTPDGQRQIMDRNHNLVRPEDLSARDREHARGILQRYLATAKDRSEGAINRIFSEVPKDAIVRGDAVEFRALLEKPSNGRAPVEVCKPFLSNVHDNFLAQYADKAGVTMGYLRELGAVDSQWARDLMAHVLTTHAANALRGSRNLVRGIGGRDGQKGEVRAFLSDKFRRIDCRPGLESLIKVAQESGGYVTDAVVSDTRASVRVLLPEVIEVGPGEFVVLGLSWSNSDYGRGAQALASFLLRLWCLNGATLETELRQVHLGGRLSDDVTYSERTRRLDAAATTSAIRDAARELLSGERVGQTAEVLRAAAIEKIDPKVRFADLRKRLGKTLADKVAEAYNGPDVENLPSGNTAWRLSNAISWVAGESDAETRLDLERAAGDALRKAA